MANLKAALAGGLSAVNRRARPLSWALLALGLAACLVLPLASKPVSLDEKSLMVGGAELGFRWEMESTLWAGSPRSGRMTSPNLIRIHSACRRRYTCRAAGGRAPATPCRLPTSRPSRQLLPGEASKRWCAARPPL